MSKLTTAFLLITTIVLNSANAAVEVPPEYLIPDELPAEYSVPNGLSSQFSTSNELPKDFETPTQTREELLKSQNMKEPEYKKLSGDPKTACEVILCLSSGTKMPSECRRPVSRYFSIKSWRLHKQIRKRKSFLSLCPKTNDNEVQHVMSNAEIVENNHRLDDLVDTIGELRHSCTAEKFNTMVDERSIGYRSSRDDNHDTKMRTITESPANCTRLFNHNFYNAEGKPKYVCNKKWYAADDYRRGYEMVPTGKYRYGRYTTSDGDSKYGRIAIMKKQPIQKNCWK